MERPQKNNNPFALIQKKPSAWQGLAGKDADGFLKFDSPYYGARAGFINLINTYLTQGMNTIEKIFPVYAPLGHGANVPENYINFVVKFTGIPRNKVITTADEIFKIGKAIVTNEEGKFWMSATDFENAFRAANVQMKFENRIKSAGKGAAGLLLIILIFLTYTIYENT